MSDTRPRLFISSSFAATDSGEGDLTALRRMLRDSAERIGAEIVLAEDEKGVREAADRHDHIAIMDRCIALAQECDGFVGLLHERHGSRIELSIAGVERQASVSIFESELLQACIQNKPTLILRIKGFAPGEALSELLRIIDPAIGAATKIVHERDIIPTLRDFVSAMRRRKAPLVSWLTDLLSIRRIRRQVVRETDDPHLLYLRGAYRASSPRDVDAALAARALDAGRSGVDPDHGRLGQAARLSFLWLAVRELAKADEAARHGDLFDLWADVLGAWNSSAAWYGLHGPHPMGCLATLNSLTLACEVSGRRPAPLGARASAYYSCAGIARGGSIKRRYFRQALDLSSRQLRGAQGLERASAHGLRGSCRARLAELGDRLQMFGALSDYREALRLRERLGAGESAVGESMSEYGYALARVPGLAKQGLAMTKEGVCRLQAAETDRELGFLFRAQRKEADLLLRLGRVDEAIDVLEPAIARAREAGVLDQARQLEALAQKARARKRKRTKFRTPKTLQP